MRGGAPRVRTSVDDAVERVAQFVLKPSPGISLEKAKMVQTLPGTKRWFLYS